MDGPKLRILLLEDIPNDAELATRELLQDGLVFDWRRVEDETGFLRELAEFSPDLILSDYTMPNFDAMKALRILQEAGWEIPFILVTGSQSEETAAAVMREGADDYILKSSLVRLPLSVRHTLERWRTKRALRESEERWQFALEGTGDGVWDWNPQTGAVYFSPQWKAMLGYDEEEIEPDGGTWERLIHPEDREETLARLEAYLQGWAPAYRSEYRLLCKDGSYKWTLSRGKVIRYDAGGKPLRVIGTQSDITERKRAEETLQESEERFRAIAEQTSDVVFITDTRGVITYLSPAATKVFGVPMDEMLDIHFTDLLPPESVDAAVAAFTDAIERGTPRRNLELKMKRKDGSEFYGEVSGSLFKVGGFTGAAGTIRDITERKQLEREAEQARTDFLYAVSHELKTPLFLMTVGLELLRGLPPEERQRKFLEQEEVWQRNLLRLRFLINNLLDSQRTRTIGLRLSRVPTDLAALVRQAVADLDVLVQRQNLHFELDLAPLPPLSLDAEAMERTVHNLLSNAIKFSKPKGEVRVRLGQEEGRILLEVEDHGQGIPAEAISDLFQPFARVESVVKAVIPGTGLGLYVSRILTEAHGGTISLESKEGKGTKVTVRLPLG